MRVIRNKPHSRGQLAKKGLGILLVMVLISFGAAAAWQRAQNTIPPEADAPGSVLQEDPLVEPESGAVPAEGQVRDAEEGQDMQSESPGSGDSSLPEQEGTDADVSPAPSGEAPETAGQKPAPAANALPESAKVDNIYFEDAIFFGDSLSTGIPLYQVAGNPDTVAFTGIDPVGINTNEVIPTPEGKKTVLEAAKQYGEKKKVYIMLGANALWMDEDSFASGYRDFIGNVEAQYPEADIYIQSILPVTTDAYLTYSTADNAVINRFNERLQGLAGSGVYYLDVAQALMDDTGALPKEASPLDGMHLTPEYYAKWFDYLKTHTVEEK